MKLSKSFSVLILLLCCFSISLAQNPFKKNQLDSIFSGYSASFIVTESNGNLIYSFNPEEDNKPDSPCSTFKIFNSLVALETKTIPDENYLMKWNGEKTWNENWNRDHTLRSAFPFSVVWYYRELARMIGHDSMQKYIDLADYGNKDLSGGIDKFWLVNSFKVTPMDQLKLIKGLVNCELPFSKRNIDIVKSIMILHQDSISVFRGKTGSGSYDGKTDTGWFIGYITIRDSVKLFVIRLNGPGASGLKAKGMLIKIFNEIYSTKIQG